VVWEWGEGEGMVEIQRNAPKGTNPVSSWGTLGVPLPAYDLME
jgi:hypothetical protein